MENKPTEPLNAASLPPSSFYHEEDFISLRDMLKMVFKHARAIALITILVTAAVAVTVLLKPRRYSAEAVLQVVMPQGIGQRPDRETHEANILSHLEYLKSSVVIARVADELNLDENSDINLWHAVKVERPPRSSLLRICTYAKSAEQALQISDIWRQEYLDLLADRS
ncbi:MAG: Wzz/FepE/Etk N-terminal domain-containing protein, partial [Kiritimatiellia bacterium]